MIKETVTMSHKELGRLQIIQESINRHITQEQAAARIGISIRQVKRLVQRYRNEGPSGLVSRRRGKRPNNFSALMALRFVPAETIRAYMETLRGYLNDHGVPLALYSDRHSIFRVNNPEREGELTQFTRAIKTLGIEPVLMSAMSEERKFASTPRTLIVL